VSIAVVPGPPTRLAGLAGLAAIPNFRDVGGHRTSDGAVVRSGLLYRSTDLRRADDATRASLEALGIRTIFDLRTVDERTLWPEDGRLPSATTYVTPDVLRDAPEASPARLAPLMESPAQVRELLADGRGERLFLRKYREFVNLTSARQAYHLVLSDLAIERNLPAVIHCTTGKDRTGWAVAVLLLLMGVPEQDVIDDYLASNVALEEANRSVTERFVALGGEPELLEPLMTAKLEYLQTALDEMRRGFGSIEGYVDAGLAIGPATRRRLRAIFIDRS
jgi:protein-tyrosine phosphatase